MNPFSPFPFCFQCRMPGLSGCFVPTAPATHVVSEEPSEWELNHVFRVVRLPKVFWHSAWGCMFHHGVLLKTLCVQWNKQWSDRPENSMAHTTCVSTVASSGDSPPGIWDTRWDCPPAGTMRCAKAILIFWVPEQTDFWANHALGTSWGGQIFPSGARHSSSHTGHQKARIRFLLMTSQKPPNSPVSAWMGRKGYPVQPSIFSSSNLRILSRYSLSLCLHCLNAFESWEG